MKIKTIFFCLILLIGDYLHIYANIVSKEGIYSGCAPLSLTFYSTTPKSSYNWDLGNSSFSTADTAHAQYTYSGDYTITLGTETITIHVLDKPNIMFHPIGPTQGCLPFTMNLDASDCVFPAGVNGVKYEWVFGNGDTAIGKIISKIVTNYEPKIFVQLFVTASDITCNAQLRIDSVYNTLSKPIAKINYSPKSACYLPLTITTTNASSSSVNNNVTYQWNWKNPTENVMYTKNINPITYNKIGNYTIILKAINQFGCNSYDTAFINIDTPTVSFKLSNDTVCADNFTVYKIDNLDSFNYNYTFDINYFDVNYSTGEVVPNNLTEGLYPLTLTKVSKADPRCKSTFTKYIQIIAPNPVLKSKQNLSCSFPIIDTLYDFNVTKWVDEIYFGYQVKDKYSNVLNFFSKNTIPSDTICPINIIATKADSFYRFENLRIKKITSFYNKTAACGKPTAIDMVLQSILSGFIVANKLAACVNDSITFKALTNNTDTIQSVQWNFGDGTIVTINDTIVKHKYLHSGTYRVLAVVYDKYSCSDTTNSLFVTVGDSIPPTFTMSKTSICFNDILTLTNTSSTTYDKYYFTVDNYESDDCENNQTVNWTNFQHLGKQAVKFTVDNNGCIAQTIDSITVTGSMAKIQFDHNCIARDSFLFYPIDTANATQFYWDFGDGTPPINTSNYYIGHKYNAVGDYTVKMHPTNGSVTCTSFDSTIVHVRHVKARINVDSLQCKITGKSFFINGFQYTIYNGFPYVLDPTLSTDADYICNYNFTWYFTGNGVTQRPITYGNKVNVEFESSKFDLHLIARDINGCEDTSSQSMWVDTTYINFLMNKVRYCRDTALVTLTNLSKSPFGIKSYEWIVRRKNGGINTLFYSTDKDPSFILINKISQKDTFEVILNIKDSANCADKSLYKELIFYRDTNLLNVERDTICLDNNSNFYYTDSTSNTVFQWYLNDVLTPVHTYYYREPMKTIGNFKLKLVKFNTQYGCVDSFIRSIIVKQKPHIYFFNQADTAKVLCFPSITEALIIDTENTNYTVRWTLNHNQPTFINPSHFALDPGINTLIAEITTTYGCYIKMINYDTLIHPSAIMTISKPNICKGDSILFKITHKVDVDSFVWNFGDGTLDETKKDSIYHVYSTKPNNRDSTSASIIYFGKNNQCPNGTSQKIYYFDAKASFDRNNEIDTSYCLAPYSLYNTSLEGDNYRWTLGDGNSKYTKDVLQYNYSKDGKYLVTLFAYRNIGCVDSMSKWVELYPNPKILATIDSTCLGDSSLVIVSDTMDHVTQKIKIDSLFYPINFNQFKFWINKEMPITLYSTSLKNCLDSIVLTPKLIKPIIMDSLDTTVMAGAKVILPYLYNPKYSYTWSSNSDSLSCIRCNYPYIQPINASQFTVSAIDYRHCFNVKTTYKINIFPDIKVVVPTAFTPNGDGNNDIIYARGFGIKKLNYFKIFNRMGQLLFVSNNENDGWNGYYKNELQNAEPYFYYWEAESFIPGKIVSGEGNFMLLK